MRIKLYSILVYNLLFTQAPIPVCLDDTTIIDSSSTIILVVQMTSSRVIDKMVVDEGRALQPCRYRLFTQGLYYSLPIQHITVPWVHTRDNQHRRKQLPTRTTTQTLNVGKVT